MNPENTDKQSLTPEQRAWHEQAESKEYYAILSMFIEMWWVWWKADPSNEQHLRPEQWQTTEVGKKYLPLYFLDINLRGKLNANMRKFSDYIQRLIGLGPTPEQISFTTSFLAFLSTMHARFTVLAHSSRTERINTSTNPLQDAIGSGLATAFHSMYSSTGAIEPNLYGSLQKILSGIELDNISRAMQVLKQRSQYRFPAMKPRYVVDENILRVWGLGTALPCPAGSSAPQLFKEHMLEWRNFLKVPTDQRIYPLRECVQWYADHIEQDILPWYQKLSRHRRLKVCKTDRIQLENWMNLAKQAQAIRGVKEHHALP